MKKRRNYVLKEVIEENPGLLRERTVYPERGKGRKNRPRKKYIIIIEND